LNPNRDEPAVVLPIAAFQAAIREFYLLIDTKLISFREPQKQNAPGFYPESAWPEPRGDRGDRPPGKEISLVGAGIHSGIQ
jgi:hypothetical protein